MGGIDEHRFNVEEAVEQLDDDNLTHEDDGGDGLLFYRMLVPSYHLHVLFEIFQIKSKLFFYLLDIY